MSDQGAEKSVTTLVAEAADKKLNGKGDSGEVVLSTGVKLKILKLPPLTMMESLTIVRRPSAPMYYDERLKRHIENPDHPDYKDQLSKYQLDYALGVMNAMILFGVEIVSIPKGLPKPEDDDWVEKMQLSHMDTMPKSKNWRKLAWIKAVAVADENDSNLLMEAVGQASGVREADVDAAALAFRSQKEQ